MGVMEGGAASDNGNGNGNGNGNDWLGNDYKYLFFHLICPTLGCFVATMTFAAPIADLRRALLQRSLGDLNPRPWAVMTGNCLGWCIYAYCIENPFILASNVPGFILSLWLNAGAAKLEYFQQTSTSTRNSTLQKSHNQNLLVQERMNHPILRTTTRHRPVPPPLHTNENAGTDSLNEIQQHPQAHDHSIPLDTHEFPPPIFTTQELWWLRIMIGWTVIVVWIGWISPFYYGYGNENNYEYNNSTNRYGIGSSQALMVGILVNLNLIFFYGVPLQTMKQVLLTKTSNSIHPPSMMMAIGNATFWFLYGVALWDPVVMLPNSIGLALGLCQVLLCLLYPRIDTISSSTTAGRSLIISGPSTGGGVHLFDDADTDADAYCDADDDDVLEEKDWQNQEGDISMINLRRAGTETHTGTGKEIL